jgi:hypothetical protein
MVSCLRSSKGEYPFFLRLADVQFGEEIIGTVRVDCTHAHKDDNQSSQDPSDKEPNCVRPDLVPDGKGMDNDTEKTKGEGITRTLRYGMCHKIAITGKSVMVVSEIRLM